MVLPVDVATVTVSGTAVRADGSAAAGAVAAFTMPTWLVDTTSHAAVVPRTFAAAANASGAWSVAVIATDQAQISPLNWAYSFTLNDAGTVLDYGDVHVPSTPATTTFDALVPTDVVMGSPNLYVPLAQKAAAGGVASLGSDGKVPSSQLPASSGGTAVSSVTAADASITVGGTATDPTIKVATATQALISGALQLAPIEPAAAAYSCHAIAPCDPAACRDQSTIGEQWFTRILVRAGRQINLVKVLVATAGTLSTSGLNGFALYSDDWSKVWESVSDDTMWTTTGEVSKAVSGAITGLSNRTPAVDTWFRVGVSAGRGYSAAPRFSFANFAGSSVLSDAGNYRGRYRPSAYSSWPATINPATDLAATLGFVVPVMIG